MYCRWYGNVSPTGNRGLTAGRRWLRLRVWISLKQSSTLLSPCPLLRDMFTAFSYNGRSPLSSRFTSLRYICSPPCCLTIYHCLYLILHSLSLSHSPPTLRLTKCCGASTAGCLQICYITGPSASLNHCWARLASA